MHSSRYEDTQNYFFLISPQNMLWVPYPLEAPHQRISHE